MADSEFFMSLRVIQILCRHMQGSPFSQIKLLKVKTNIKILETIMRFDFIDVPAELEDARDSQGSGSV